MENETNELTDNNSVAPVEDRNQNADSPASAQKNPRPRRQPKPLVEGINAPVGGTPFPAPGGSTIVPPKVTLTSSEKKLIEDPAPQPVPSPSGLKSPLRSAVPAEQKIFLPQRKPSGRKAAWAILMSLLAVCAVFGAYLWLTGQPVVSDGQVLGLFPRRLNAPAPEQNTPAAKQPEKAEPVPPLAATGTPVSSTGTPAVLPKTLTITSTPTGYLNVRSGPGTSNKLLTRVYPGESYSYEDTKSGWFLILLPDGSKGWVTGQYANPAR